MGLHSLNYHNRVISFFKKGVNELKCYKNFRWVFTLTRARSHKAINIYSNKTIHLRPR